MMKNWLICIACVLAMTGCASIPGAPHAASRAKPSPKAHAKIHTQPHSLLQMDPAFLYLAAQAAEQNDQPELAARFLSALIAKDPTAAEPRMELAGLYMQLNQPPLALQQIEAARKIPGLSRDQRKSLDMLHIQALFGSGKINAAIDELRKFVDAHPDLTSARQILVQWLAGSGRIDEALATVKDGIKRADNPVLHLLEAQIYLHQGKIAEARKALLHLRRLTPDDDTPVLMLAAIAIHQRQPAKAEAILRGYLRNHADDTQIGNMLGRLLVRQGRIKEAIDVYTRISQQTGGDPDVLTALGLLYFQQGNYAAAATQFQDALDKQPDSQTHYYLGLAQEGQGNDKLALAQYRAVPAKDSLYPDAQLRIADIEFRQHKDQAAIKRTKAILTAHPNDGEAYLMLSLIRLARQEYRLLLNETAPALKLSVIPTRLLFNRAVAFDHFKQYTQLDQSLHRLLRAQPDNAEALNFLGYSLAERGIQLNQAERLVKRALKIKPNDGYYLDSLGWVYFKLGKYAEAIKVQRRAIGIVKHDAIMHEHLGDMYWKHGDHAKARAMWKKAIELHHKHPELLRKKIKEGI